MRKQNTTQRLCQFTKKDGKPCKAYAVSGSDFCFWHAPEKAKLREEAWSRGGKTAMGKSTVLPSSQFRLERLDNVVILIEDTINQVRTGQLDVRIAQVTGHLASIAVKLLEQIDLERRITALEEIMSERRR